jgi:hypothetical protein
MSCLEASGLDHLEDSGWGIGLATACGETGLSKSIRGFPEVTRGPQKTLDGMDLRPAKHCCVNLGKVAAGLSKALKARRRQRGLP